MENYYSEDHSAYSVPACICDWGPYPHDECIDGQNQEPNGPNEPTTGISGDEESGDGEGTTGNDDGSDGDSGTTGPTPPPIYEYVCNKADAKCAEINYIDEPLLNDIIECWSDPPPCVNAIDTDDAIKQCEKQCNDRMGEIKAAVMMYNDDPENDDNKEIKSPIDCFYSDDPPSARPYIKGMTDECTPPTDTNVLPVWGGDSQTYAYRGSVSFADSSGGSAGVGNLWGYLAYEFSPACATTSTSCTVRFDALEGLAQDVSAFYTDASGSTVNVTLDDLDIRLVQVVEGIYYPQRGSITFPNIPFGFILSSSSVSATSTTTASFGPMTRLAVATSASAMLNSSGLTLHLNYSTRAGSGTLTLQTQ